MGNFGREAIRIAVQVLLASEECLCVQIFEQLGSIQDTCFVEAAKGTFVEFENAIQRENSKSAIPGGAIHPFNCSNTSISTSFSEHCQQEKTI